MIKLGARGRSKAFQILLDITTILRYRMVWPLRIEKHSIWTQKYLPILGHILILGCRITMRDLWRKVHDHAQFFVLCIHTFQLVSSSVRSKQLLCFVHGQGRKREQKHATKNSINCYCHVLSNACWFSCCSLWAGSHCCSFVFSRKVVMVVRGEHILPEGAVWMRWRGSTMLPKVRLPIPKSVQKLW